MKIINKENVVLHKEANELLEEAKLDGWEYCFIRLNELCPQRYPSLSFVEGDINLSVSTVPGYITQKILGRPYISVDYDICLLTLDEILQLRQIVPKFEGKQ